MSHSKDIFTKLLKVTGAASGAAIPSTVADSSSDGGAAAVGGGDAAFSLGSGCGLVFFIFGAEISVSVTASCAIFLRLVDILFCVWC